MQETGTTIYSPYPRRLERLPTELTRRRSHPIRLVLPFKDQASADIARAQLKALSQMIQTTLQPVFVSQKTGRAKPPIVNQPCLVYKFEWDLCDAGYVGFTRCHLELPSSDKHAREQRKHKYLSPCKISFIYQYI